ncbi:unnamed protein product, partial [Urochloa humidicola]
FPNGRPDPSPIWPGPMRPGTIRPDAFFVPGCRADLSVAPFSGRAGTTAQRPMGYAGPKQQGTGDPAAAAGPEQEATGAAAGKAGSTSPEIQKLLAEVEVTPAEMLAAAAWPELRASTAKAVQAGVAGAPPLPAEAARELRHFPAAGAVQAGAPPLLGGVQMVRRPTQMGRKGAVGDADRGGGSGRRRVSGEEGAASGVDRG